MKWWLFSCSSRSVLGTFLVDLLVADFWAALTKEERYVHNDVDDNSHCDVHTTLYQIYQEHSSAVSGRVLAWD